MRKALVLIAGMTMVTGMAFAAGTTTGAPIRTTDGAVHIEKERITTNGTVNIEFNKTSDGAIHIERERITTDGTINVDFTKTTDGAIHLEKVKVTTDGSMVMEFDKTTDGAIHMEREKTTTDGTIIVHKEFDKTSDGAIKIKTTGSGIEFEKGKAYGKQREKNPVAEANINKVKPAELTDAEKAALKEKMEALKAAKEKEDTSGVKKAKLGKSKK